MTWEQSNLNLLVIPVVETILSASYGLKLGMLCYFNTTFFYHKQPQIIAPPDQRVEIEENGDDDQELIQTLNEVEELFG